MVDGGLCDTRRKRHLCDQGVPGPGPWQLALTAAQTRTAHVSPSPQGGQKELTEKQNKTQHLDNYFLNSFLSFSSFMEK